jgi:hypothetical protein
MEERQRNFIRYLQEQTTHFFAGVVLCIVKKDRDQTGDRQIDRKKGKKKT